MIRVYIDAQLRAVREALCRALNSEPGFEGRCDLINKCDIAVRDLHARTPPFPDPFVIPTLAIISRAQEVEAGPALLRQRYAGILWEDDDFETLLRAFKTVARGEVWASRDLLTRTLLDSSPPTLTERERQVLRYLLEGRSNRDIAAALGITVRTVKSHVSNLLAKHGAKNRVELILHYSENHGNHGGHPATAP